MQIENWLLNNLWIILVAWVGYEKKTVDTRLRELEVKNAVQETGIAVMNEAITSMRELVEVKLSNIEDSINRIETDTRGKHE